MLLAEIGSTPYNVMLLLHIAAAIVGFGAPIGAAFVRRLAVGSGGAPTAAGAEVTLTLRVSIPAIIVTGLLGFALAGMSDDVFKIAEDRWIQLSILLWLAQVLVYAFVILPGLRKVAAGDESAAGRLGLFGGLIHLSLVVILWLMVWQPALGG